ncbi:hypothetical protein [Crossiella sp. CA198]|uniref:hypothetical protein n=1 Tax=Crossiella sp. CA198 TaxID=3455607 RepID=UPI003F8D05AE
MPGTNAVVIKKALVTLLAAAPSLATVQVAYQWPGRITERELIHLGRVRASQEYAAFKATGRIPRHETLMVSVHIIVTLPGGSVEETDERATALGLVLEELVAGDANLTDPAGLLYGGVDSVELDYELTDDGATSVLTYELKFESRLT